MKREDVKNKIPGITDEHLNSSTIEALKQIPSMYRVRVIK